MKVLSNSEIQAVSGAGKVQDFLTESYGNLFAGAATFLNNVFNMGYETEAAQKAGQDFGSRLGGSIETAFNNVLDFLRNSVVG